jgi:hypothetical protein
MYCNGTRDGYWADTADLEATPQGGDTIRFWFLITANNGALSLVYGAEPAASSSYGYEVRVEPANNVFEMVNTETNNTLGSASQSYTTGKWYYVEVDISSDENTHTARLYDSDGTTQLNQISGSESGAFGTAIIWRWGWYNIDGSVYLDDLGIK